jgi:hypothetical protein
MMWKATLAEDVIVVSSGALVGLCATVAIFNGMCKRLLLWSVVMAVSAVLGLAVRREYMWATAIALWLVDVAALWHAQYIHRPRREWSRGLISASLTTVILDVAEEQAEWKWRIVPVLAWWILVAWTFAAQQHRAHKRPYQLHQPRRSWMVSLLALGLAHSTSRFDVRFALVWISLAIQSHTPRARDILHDVAFAAPFPFHEAAAFTEHELQVLQKLPLPPTRPRRERTLAVQQRGEVPTLFAPMGRLHVRQDGPMPFYCTALHTPADDSAATCPRALLPWTDIRWYTPLSCLHIWNTQATLMDCYLYTCGGGRNRDVQGFAEAVAAVLETGVWDELSFWLRLQATAEELAVLEHAVLQHTHLMFANSWLTDIHSASDTLLFLRLMAADEAQDDQASGVSLFVELFRSLVLYGCTMANGDLCRRILPACQRALQSPAVEGASDSDASTPPSTLAVATELVAEVSAMDGYEEIWLPTGYQQALSLSKQATACLHGHNEPTTVELQLLIQTHTALKLASQQQQPHLTLAQVQYACRHLRLPPEVSGSTAYVAYTAMEEPDLALFRMFWNEFVQGTFHVRTFIEAWHQMCKSVALLGRHTTHLLDLVHSQMDVYAPWIPQAEGSHRCPTLRDAALLLEHCNRRLVAPTGDDAVEDYSTADEACRALHQRLFSGMHLHWIAHLLHIQFGRSTSVVLRPYMSPLLDTLPRHLLVEPVLPRTIQQFASTNPFPYLQIVCQRPLVYVLAQAKGS